jgi:hypothetical protein
LLFGLVILGALPFFYYSIGNYGPSSGSSIGGAIAVKPSFLYRFNLGGFPGQHPWGAAVYWLTAMPLAFILVAVYYRVRARRTGLQGRVWPYVVAGIVLFALLLASAPGILVLLHAPRWMLSWQGYASDLYIRGLTPVLVIAIAFFVLARVEHSKVLLAIALGFVPIALAANLYNISNAFQRLHWIVPDWAANATVAGGYLVFFGLVALIALGVGGGRHEPSS